MIPLALVAQGVSMLSSFIGSSGPSSAQLQMEVINQLNEVNANLVRQNRILVEVAKKIEQIPEKEALFVAKTTTTNLELELGLILDTYQPEGISVTKPEEHYLKIEELYDEVRTAAKSIRSVLVHTKDIEHSMVELSYPIISLMENLRLLAGVLCFPAWLAQLINSDEAKLEDDFEPEQKVPPEEYQAITRFVRETYKSIYDEFGPNYLTLIAKKAASFADPGGSVPGRLQFSGCGYKQERFKTLLRSKTWVTHRTTFYRGIELASGFGPVQETLGNKPFEFNITLDGDVARRDWREPYERMDKKFKHFFGDHRKAQGLNKGQLAAYKVSQAKRISDDPKNYKNIFKKKLKLFRFTSPGSPGFRPGGFQPANKKEVQEVLSQVYFLEQKFSNQQAKDLDEFRKKSKLESSYRSANEHISIYIYMTGILHYLGKRVEELDEEIAAW